MRKITTHEAKTHLSKILAEVQRGEEYILCRGDMPVARLIPISGEEIRRQRPSLGTITSQGVSYSSDVFAPLSPTELGEWGLWGCFRIPAP